MKGQGLAIAVAAGLALWAWQSGKAKAAVPAKIEIGGYSGYMRSPSGEVIKVPETDIEKYRALGYTELSPFAAGQFLEAGKIVAVAPAVPILTTLPSGIVVQTTPISPGVSEVITIAVPDELKPITEAELNAAQSEAIASGTDFDTDPYTVKPWSFKIATSQTIQQVADLYRRNQNAVIFGYFLGPGAGAQPMYAMNWLLTVAPDVLNTLPPPYPWGSWAALWEDARLAQGA